LWKRAYKKFVLSSRKAILGLEKCESDQETRNRVNVKYISETIEKNSPADNVQNQFGDQVCRVPPVI
jgi:hypothetical protein